MMLDFGFGKNSQIVEIPDSNLVSILLPNKLEFGLTEEAEVIRALKTPIGSKRLRDIAKEGERIVIITSDITRPMPTSKVLPALLDELYSAGVHSKDIILVFALGIHRKHTKEERRYLAGNRAYSEITCIDSDATDFVHLGYTTRGTPVDIVRIVAEADKRICLGNIEYHYFAGYSGGAKAIMPGVSTYQAIQKNHSHIVEESAHAGKIDGNPIRDDIEEAAALCGVDFILNVILDEKKRIVKAVAGDVTEAHREGCRFLDTMYLKRIPHLADIVIVSQGGAPKDINLYQTQKALDNAKFAVRKGGIIILIGSCEEGLGDHVFEEWMTESPTSASMIERINRDFQLGGHKAAAIAMVLKDADIYLVSELAPELVKKIFMMPFKTAQEALSAAFLKLGDEATVLAMPYGGSILPKMGIL